MTRPWQISPQIKAVVADMRDNPSSWSLGLATVSTGFSLRKGGALVYETGYSHRDVLTLGGISLRWADARAINKAVALLALDKAEMKLRPHSGGTP